MDTEILRSLMNCSLTEEEAKPVLLEEDDLIDGVVECEASAFVKIHALKLGFVSLQNFTLAMAKAWNCKDIRVSRVAGPILHVFFPFIEEKMQEKFYTKVVASKLSFSFMACEVMELLKDKAGKKFFRVKDMVNVHQPVRRLVNFQVGKMQGVGYLAYERLPYLCFHCGLMGHLIIYQKGRRHKRMWCMAFRSKLRLRSRGLNFGSLSMVSPMRNHRCLRRRRRSTRREWWWRRES
ncbi:hypothetical protein LIER_13933 [Lithospermum erythrorhizon]|uniref:Uncharacterized protein n=1 Tax=Lithospermum erythrorhizon TaxID=34254 RepID=A0AAV3PXN6_LITER